MHAILYIVRECWTRNFNIVFQHHLGIIKQKSASEHAQNVRIHIILHMPKVSAGHLLSIETFYTKYPIILFADSEGPDQTAWMRRLIWAFTVCICLVFAWHGSLGKVFFAWHFNLNVKVNL